MQFLDFPNEILLEILRCGGISLLMGGLSACNRRLRDLSNQSVLWKDSIETELEAQHLSREGFKEIKDYRAWYAHLKETACLVNNELDAIVEHAATCSPSEIENCAWRILKTGPSVITAFSGVLKRPKTLMHYHWAGWLILAAAQVQSTKRLLAISDETNWGEDIMEDPLDVVICLHTLLLGEYPQILYDSSRYNMTSSKIKEDFGTSKPRIDLIEALTHHVKLKYSTKTHYMFLITLGRSCMFMHMASQLGWKTRLLRTNIGIYVSIMREGANPIFVDFQRDGNTRTLDDIRNLLAASRNTFKTQYGITFQDIVTTIINMSIREPLDNMSPNVKMFKLIESMTVMASSPPLAQVPHVFLNIASRFILRRNYPARPPPNLWPDPVAPDGGWLQRGAIVRVYRVITDLPSPPPSLSLSWSEALEFSLEHERSGFSFVPYITQTARQCEYGVILTADVKGGSIVLCGREQRRVLEHLLLPSVPPPVTTFNELVLPDIGLDVDILGQHFKCYNENDHVFE